MNPLLTQSATALAARIRAGELSSRDVVEAHIARVRAVNPRINAVVADRFVSARREADAADERLRREGPDRLPPLHGVPCTVKECFALAGMPQTSGIVARRGIVADRDADAVARLRAAGAIPLGVTNTSEACMWMETVNRVYGRTNNPYDPRRTVGGSSGGEGAIVGAGGSPFGLGSDIGGSIRMPAFFNGVFGHKPSGGLVSNAGQFPVAQGDAARCLGTGPLARRAEDLWPLLQVLADAPVAGSPADVDWSAVTVHDLAAHEVLPVHRELREVQQRAVAHLASLGARVVPANLPELRRVFDLWSAMLSMAGDESFTSLLGNGTPIRVRRQLAAWALGRSAHTLPVLGLAVLEPLGTKLPKRTQRLLAQGRELRDRLTSLVGPGGLIVAPPFYAPAPRHFEPLLRPFRIAFTALFNLTEFAATSVPLGLGRAGLPLGVQVAGVPGSDHLTIAAAAALEARFGGWVPPPGRG